MKTDERPSKNRDLAEFEALAEACKALSHPARLAILRGLAERGTCLCGEIVDGIPLSQATVSQHLKILKEAGLITGTIDGPRTCYCLDVKAIAGLRKSTEALFGKLESCC